jgi:hypothetical protein
MAMTPAKVQKMAAVYRAVSKERNGGGDGGAHVKKREPSVAKGRDGIAEKGDAEEDEKDLVVGALENTDPGRGLGVAGIGVGLVKDIDATDEEEGGAKVDGEGDGDVANDVEPAADPASDTAPARRGQHKGLVVDTAGGGIDTGDFTQGGGDADDDEGDSDPSPDDVDGTAADQRVVERGCETVGDGGEDKGHEGDLEGRAVAAQLGLVAEVLEQLVGRLLVAGYPTTFPCDSLGLVGLFSVVSIVHGERIDVAVKQIW